MENLSVLVIGGGIGGLTAAIALGKRGFNVTVIEKDPSWSVYGVGIIQQSNVIRAVAQLGILDDYIDSGFGFDQLEIYLPNGARVAVVDSPRLVPDRPANVGIGRRALQQVLAARTRSLGIAVRLGVTATRLDDDGRGVTVQFSDSSSGRFDLVIGADGLYSTTRTAIFPDAPRPEFTGQSVWRYNFPRPADVVNLCVYNGPTGVGLVPLSKQLMYMYVTTPEPGNPRYPAQGLAQAMRSKLVGQSGRIAELATRIVDDEGVVYKPLESLMVNGAWHRGRIVLLGDAVHATTPHLGQGAGMAIEDSVVLAEELARHATPEAAFEAYHTRRFERCRYIVEASRAVCLGQLGKGPPVDNAKATADMFQVIAQEI